MTESRREAGAAARILIVDDHEDNVELLRARLASWGYEPESAADGAEALEKVEQSPPDLILLDVMMPRIDGMEVARRIKANNALPFIPIIMQTALDATENKVEGLEAGADDYITKPIDFAELKARLNSMLRIKRLQEELEERERQLLEANERLRYMSQTDALTGLDNRRQLEERIDEMFEHAKRLNEPFACVMCDLDRFKSVNDTYGHQAGDAVLKQLALALLELFLQPLDAEHRLEPRLQLGEVNGLGDVVVRARLEALHLVLGGVERRLHDDRDERQRGVGLDAARDLHAVDARHHHVEQDQIGRRLLDLVERLHAIRR